MPAPPIADSVVQQALDALNIHGNIASAARALSVPWGTLAHRIKIAQSRGFTAANVAPFEGHRLTDETLPAEAIIKRRKEQYAHLDRAKRERILIPVKVKLDGPIAISHFGDPHLDDDGTDIEKVERHVSVINRTEGMFAGNIGDTLNNWTGRLARLYSEQSTSAAEAWRLGEWFLRSMPWLYVLGGNHGAWSGAGDPVKWILNNCAGYHDNFSVRLALEFPNGKQVRINARHDFTGRSMWSSIHGAVKAATMGWRDHLLTCGHLHTSGYAVLKDPASGLISHAVRVSSYKTWDRYGHEKGLPNQDIFCNATTIIDPRYADDDPRLIHVVFDPEQAADYLTWLRGRK